MAILPGGEDLEVELGLVLNAWVDRIGLDAVIEALQFYLHAFELRADLVEAAKADEQGAGQPSE